MIELIPIEPAAQEESDQTDEILVARARTALATGNAVLVSSWPLIKYAADRADQYYANCEPVKELVGVVTYVGRSAIDPTLNRHLGAEFTGDYYVANILDTETGDEYRIGLRSLLLGTTIELGDSN